MIVNLYEPYCPHSLGTGVVTRVFVCLYFNYIKILKNAVNLTYSYSIDQYTFLCLPLKSKYCLYCKAVSILVFIFFIASTIDTLHNTINGYEIACIWKSIYNVHVCMIQTNADFIFHKLIVFVSC